MKIKQKTKNYVEKKEAKTAILNQEVPVKKKLLNYANLEIQFLVR